MPGLFGIVDAQHPSKELDSELRSLVCRMAHAMATEPPDLPFIVSGTGVSACAGRVSLDGDRAAKPLANKSGLAIVAAGEHAAVANDASTEADSGADVVRRLSGRCAAFVVDGARNTCFLLNDR